MQDTAQPPPVHIADPSMYRKQVPEPGQATPAAAIAPLLLTSLDHWQPDSGPQAWRPASPLQNHMVTAPGRVDLN